MDKRFTRINPRLCRGRGYGDEPSLKYIIEHYYRSYGFDLDQSQKFAEKYVKAWIKKENLMKIEE